MLQLVRWKIEKAAIKGGQSVEGGNWEQDGFKDTRAHSGQDSS